MPFYRIGVLGAPSADQLNEFNELLLRALASYQLAVPADVEVLVQPARLAPLPEGCTVAVFFGGEVAVSQTIGSVLNIEEMTVIPVVSTETRVAQEIPADLQARNCLALSHGGMERVVSATLECLGLLRRQRQIFLSYRRSESTAAALQLFDELSARGYEVFLDTHGVPPAVDFQDTLWHRLCNVDVMVMLDTPSYFASRWTTEEFGRALAKNIGVLRVEWPSTTADAVTETCSRVELTTDDLDAISGELSPAALRRIGCQLEEFRALAHAVRRQSVLTQLQFAVQTIRGRITHVGPGPSVDVDLPGNRHMTITPVIGVPDSSTLEQSVQVAKGRDAAVLYDHVGVMPSWNNHLDWLGKNVTGARWVRLSQAAWDLAGGGRR